MVEFTRLREDKMEFGIIIAVIGSAIGIISVTIMLMLWVRGEANADRRDIVNLIISIKDEINAIHLEMKDFHNRLVAIEERRGR